ncbi:PAS domain-containing protein [Hellea sp.]|nr:PAS domain-containing protein [Hellea sp.]
MIDADKITPIIGVGASAGGLEAIREMFQAFDDLPGMAFVVVQHLDPTYDSLMAQLLEKHTKMTVTQAKGGEKLEPDHVYFIPPGFGLMMDDGTLNLTEFENPRGLRRPIDDFFISLAEDQRRLSACVILSGTGSDGSRGLKAIKEHGGVCVVQEPETAKYDGMPVAAIATNLTDMVLPPNEIIALLRQFFDRYPMGEDSSEYASEVVDYIDEICGILQNTVGHNFSGYKKATLTRRIARRMQVLGIDSTAEYLKLVQADVPECEALFRDFLINVTRFYRDKKEFDDLQKLVIDPLVEQSKDDEDLRIWIPGCSSGEEAYTIAMMVSDAMRRFDANPYVQIFATDIDLQMIDIARKGVYPLSALGDLPAAFSNKYIIAGSDDFSIIPRLRDMVRFSVHNVLSDPPFSNVQLISCRNLLIYFDDNLQRKVFPLFHFALNNEEGFLFLGSSETIGRFDDLFEAKEQSSRIFARKSGRSKFSLHLPSKTSNAARRRAFSRSVSVPTVVRTNETSALNRIADKYAPVSLLVDAEGLLLERWGKAGKFLDFPQRLERNIHVPSLARTGLRELVGPMLRESRGSNKRLARKAVPVVTEFGTLPTTVICEPVGDGAFLFILKDEGNLEPFDIDAEDEFDADQGQLSYLEEELEATRQRLRTTVEELETTNEELKSSNEEMMSMNEELQSTNEELSTVNDELKSKVDQVTTANADLKNFFDSTELVVIVLDAETRIRSYTDAAKKVFEITDKDINSRLSNLKTKLSSSKYLSLVEDVSSSGKSDQYRASLQDDEGQYMVRIMPYQNAKGEVDGATLIMTDITKVLTLEGDLKQERERLRLALEVARIGVWEYEPSTDITKLDLTERSLLELDADDEGATMAPILAKLPTEDRARINTALLRAMDGEQDFDETFRIPLKDGTYRWLRGLGRRLVDGEKKKFIGVTFDVTSDRARLENRELMIREMNHRVKNLFAVISGIVSISARDASDVAVFSGELRKRIHSLGRSHSLTTRNKDGEVSSLEEMITAVIAPTLSRQKVTIKGPKVVIHSSIVTSLALIFHEWATNATKYGALSSEDSQLNVIWDLSDDEVNLSWTEIGKFDAANDQSGFGTKLIDITVQQLKGTVTGEATDKGYERTLKFKPPLQS